MPQMKRRFYFLTACVGLAVLTAGTNACGQDTTTARPGVRLSLSYPRGTIPRIIVLPIDSTPGDSTRTIIQRDLDYSDRVSPIILDQATLAGITPAPGQEPNYELFSKLGAAAIVHGTRSGSALKVQLYDVGAKRRIESRDFSVVNVPPVRDTEIRDSIMVATTAREKAIRDSVARVYGPAQRSCGEHHSRKTLAPAGSSFAIRCVVTLRRLRMSAAVLPAGKLIVGTRWLQRPRPLPPGSSMPIQSRAPPRPTTSE